MIVATTNENAYDEPVQQVAAYRAVAEDIQRQRDEAQAAHLEALATIQGAVWDMDAQRLFDELAAFIGYPPGAVRLELQKDRITTSVGEG